MTIAEIKKTAEQKMARSIDSFKGELQELRTGRAPPGILDQVHVNYYGSPVPISQVANVTLLDARTLSVQPWATGMGAKTEKATRAPVLCLNPATPAALPRVATPAPAPARAHVPAQLRPPPRVPGRAVDGRDACRVLPLPPVRVLAPSLADHENFQGAGPRCHLNPMNFSRRGFYRSPGPPAGRAGAPGALRRPGRWVVRTRGG